MCETIVLHFVPVDGVEYFLGIFGQERYVFTVGFTIFPYIVALVYKTP
jgi:hypothetical protein